MTPLERILAGEVPSIDYNDTYALQDDIETHGLRLVSMSNKSSVGYWCYNFNGKYTVNHGNGYKTLNIIKKGQCVPVMIDLPRKASKCI